MTTKLATVPTTQPASLPHFPGWLADITDRDYPGLPWEMPAKLPTVGDLRSALRMCDAVTTGAPSPAFARQCIAKLLVAFEPNTKLGADDMRLRASVWIEACGDLNDLLWAKATAEAIRSLEWMPKPAQFRALVSADLDAANRRRIRLNQMLKVYADGGPAKPFVREPYPVRLKGLRDTYKRLGKLHDAAIHERELAGIEKREPEEWALQDHPAPEPATMAIPNAKPRPLPPKMQGALLAALATRHRAQGNHGYAAQLEKQAADLGHVEPSPQPA